MNILVTGSSGFLGTHLLAELKRRGSWKVCGTNSREADLRHEGHVLDLFHHVKPDVVIHLAAVVGGIGANQAKPATFWRDNLKMGINVLEALRVHGAKRLILVGTTCSYPMCPKTIPFVEEELFDGYPEPTNAPYGIAKRALHVGAMAYAKEFGIEFTTLLPTNLYGPGDNFNLETSHVIPALIRKMHRAKEREEKSVELWGTGRATRDFLYVEDCARAIALTVEKGSAEMDATNLGSGTEISIADLAAQIRLAVHYRGELRWNSSKPDGQPRRCLNTQKAKEALGWEATTTLEEGLRKTYDWYLRETEVGM